MNYNNRYIMELASAAIFDIAPKVPSESLDWNYIFNKSIEQNIAGLLFCGVSKLDKKYLPKQVIFNNWKNAMLSTIGIMSKKNAEFISMSNILKENGIDIIGLKGCIVKNCYPVPELRTMGDFDILVKEENISEVWDIFEKNNYEVKKEPYGIVCTKGQFYWEIFFSTEDEFRINTSFWDKKFFTDIQQEQYVLCPKPDLFLAHMIVHTGKHCMRAGAGLRNLCDIAVFIKKYRTDINFKFVKDICAEQKFDKIYDYIISVINDFFYIDTDGIDYNKLNSEHFVEYILLNGVFGKQDNIMVAQAAKHEDDSISPMRKIFFPSLKILSHRYKYLQKFPFLLPIAWLHRLFNGMFKWKYSLKQMSMNTKDAIEYSKERKKWLKKLGLYSVEQGDKGE